MFRCRSAVPNLVWLITAGCTTAALAALAAPEYWVDNEWIRVSGEERASRDGQEVLLLSAECKQQGLPGFVVTHFNAAGEQTAQESPGRYCPGPGESVIFAIPLPESGTWRIEFKRAEGAM